MTMQKLVEKIKNKYGLEPYHYEDETPIYGEGMVMPDGLEAFDYYSEYYSLYESGVHRTLAGLVEMYGFFFEAHDPGTFGLYED